MNPQRRDGFTLIELLIVVVIIGILAAIAIPKFSSTREKSFVAAMKSDLRNLATQEDIYHNENFTYSTDPAVIGFVNSEGVIITISEATGTGWAATAMHPGTGSGSRSGGGRGCGTGAGWGSGRGSGRGSGSGSGSGWGSGAGRGSDRGRGGAGTGPGPSAPPSSSRRARPAPSSIVPVQPAIRPASVEEAAACLRNSRREVLGCVIYLSIPRSIVVTMT